MKLSDLKISQKTANIILESALPHMLLVLVRKGILTHDHIQSPETAIKLLLKHSRIASRGIQWCVAVDGNFLEHSVTFWRNGDRLIAIVLYATAVEQYINQMYHLILLQLQWRKSHITALIKSSNFDAKVGWMFLQFTKRPFPKPLRKRLLSVISIRNSIVHFKGETGLIDSYEDSYSKIKSQIRLLKRMSFSRDFSYLETLFTDELLKIDPHRELTVSLSESISAFRNSRNTG